MSARLIQPKKILTADIVGATPVLTQAQCMSSFSNACIQAVYDSSLNATFRVLASSASNSAKQPADNLFFDTGIFFSATNADLNSGCNLGGVGFVWVRLEITASVNGHCDVWFSAKEG